MRNLTILIAAGALGACGGSDAPEPTQTAERPASIIGDPLHNALERAESVQGTVDEHAAQMRRQIEAAEGN